MDEKDEAPPRLPMLEPGADLLRERMRALSELAAGSPLPRLGTGARPRDAAAGAGEEEVVRRRRHDALERLRRLALHVAQGAADGVLLLDAQMSAVDARVRQTAQALSREPSRPLHERMLLIGLWARTPAPTEREVRRQVLRRRRDAARVRKARTGGRR